MTSTNVYELKFDYDAASPAAFGTTEAGHADRVNKLKSNLHYTRGTTPKRVTSSGAHLRSLAPGHHSSKETSQRWRAVGDTV